MKKTFFALLVFASIIITACSSPEEESSKQTRQSDGGTDDYTIMVYLNGSDLESDGAAATNDLAEMMEIGSQDNINVVVETGGTNTWHTEGISNEYNQRWLVEEGTMELVEELDIRNMGEAETLSDFLTWGMDTYPAEKYAVIFWDHGGGSVYGFGTDELFDGDSLTLTELDTALQNTFDQTGNTFELIGFDACLMSTIETASLLEPYANYMVASQELEPGHGWNYTNILNAVTEEPTITGDNLGTIIADSFMEQAEEQQTANQITLAVTDLSKIPAVVSTLETFSAEASNTLTSSDELITFGQARAKSREFSESGMVDLADLAKKSSSQYEELSDDLISAIDDAVVYQVTSNAYSDVKGLSIYFPLNNANPEELDSFNNLDFSDSYEALLDRYYNQNVDQTNIAFDNTFTSANDNIFEVQIKPEDIPKISEIYSVIGTEEDNLFYYLGIDNDVNFDEETGIISDNFTWSTETLEDANISIFFDHETDDYARFTIPAVLNGEDVEIIVFYDYSKLDAEGYATAEIIGAWPGIDEDTGLAAREIIPIKAGDEITPLIYYYDYEADEYGYAEGDTFIADDELDLYETDLPPGDYVYGFYAIDYYGNTAQSEFYDITVE